MSMYAELDRGTVSSRTFNAVKCDLNVLCQIKLGSLTRSSGLYI